MQRVGSDISDIRSELNVKVQEIKKLKIENKLKTDEVEKWKQRYLEVTRECDKCRHLYKVLQNRLWSCKCNGLPTNRNIPLVLSNPIRTGRWKHWDALKDSSKYRRKLQYKRSIEIGLRSLTDCTTAKMELAVGSDIVNFDWDAKDLCKLKADNTFNKGKKYLCLL